MGSGIQGNFKRRFSFHHSTLGSGCRKPVLNMFYPIGTRRDDWGFEPKERPGKFNSW